MERITFRECTLTKLDKRFGVRQVSNIDTLNNWLSMPYEILEEEKKSISQFQFKFRNYLALLFFGVTVEPSSSLA